jgi:DNA modification methylase
MTGKPHRQSVLPGVDQDPHVSQISTSAPGTEGKRANDLGGSEWTRYSLSVWADIRKSPAELALRHPAMFPVALVERLIRSFTTSRDSRILDPFLGSGSTVVAARNLGRHGIGLDVNQEYLSITRSRLAQSDLFVTGQDPELILGDARDIGQYVEAGSIDFAVTSPPYWDILSQRRTADGKAIRDYGGETKDLAKLDDYHAFLDELQVVIGAVFSALRPGKYFVINVMDLRKKSTFYPFHCDVAERAQAAGFTWDDVIIWDRRHEYNNLRPLGYPFVFRLNKIHEYLLIFRKEV